MRCEVDYLLYCHVWASRIFKFFASTYTWDIGGTTNRLIYEISNFIRKFTPGLRFQCDRYFSCRCEEPAKKHEFSHVFVRDTTNTTHCKLGNGTEFHAKKLHISYIDQTMVPPARILWRFEHTKSYRRITDKAFKLREPEASSSRLESTYGQ